MASRALEFALSPAPSQSFDSVETLFQHATRLDIFPTVYQRWKSTSATAPAAAPWQRRFLRQSVLTGVFEKREPELEAALQRRELRCRAVKGVGLANTLYPDATWRDIRDIDLIADPADVPEIYRALKALGCRDAQDDAWTPEGLEAALSRPDFTFPEIRLEDTTGVTIELHWDWTGPEIPADSLFSQPEAYWVYLARHAGKHFWVSGRWCLDLELYLRKFAAQMDWGLVADLAKRNGCRRAEQGSRAICAALFPDSVAASIQAPIRRDARRLAAKAARCLLSGDHSGFLNSAAARLLRVDPWPDKLRRCLQWLSPNPRRWNEAAHRGAGGGTTLLRHWKLLAAKLTQTTFR